MNYAKKYIVRDAEAGNVIEEFDTMEEAETALEEYEAQDKAEGTYEEGFYEVVEA